MAFRIIGQEGTLYYFNSDEMTKFMEHISEGGEKLSSEKKQELEEYEEIMLQVEIENEKEIKLLMSQLGILIIQIYSPTIDPIKN